MDQPISIRPQTGTWVVRAGGAVLGETSNAILLSEANREDVVYFPRDDIAMAFLEPTDTRTVSPTLGEATHYAIVTKSQTIQDAGWSYETPHDAVAALAGYLAFYPSEMVAVEQV